MREFNAFANGKVVDAAGARKFLEVIKNSTKEEISGFLNPHLKVVQMIKAGKSLGEINSYWEPLKISFTKAGGFSGFKTIGKTIATGVNGFLFILNVAATIDDVRHLKAGDEYYPAHSKTGTIFPFLGEWDAAARPGGSSWGGACTDCEAKW